MNDYNREYYESVNYTDYHARQDRYNQLALEITNHLKVHELDQDPILDFGCATGMLIKGLISLGYEEVYGADVSEWAVEQCEAANLNVSTTTNYGRHYGLTFALDVFEHMTIDQFNEFMTQIRTKVLVFRMPICREGESDYFLECSRADSTHIIRWTRRQWEAEFRRHGFVPLPINLHTIYNSEGVYTGIALQEKFYL